MTAHPGRPLAEPRSPVGAASHLRVTEPARHLATGTTPGVSERAQRALNEAGLDPAAVRAVVAGALAEDLGEDGDVTSAATVPAASTCTAAVVARSGGCVAGLPVLLVVAELAPGPVDVEFAVRDGQRVEAGSTVAVLRGATRAVLSIERTALNLLGHLSGVATATAAWVSALEGTRARVRDTRKTVPGLRLLDKYAVRCGGGVNHRTGLFDAVLVKDNHVAAAGGIAPALAAVARAHPAGELVVQVEVDDLDQLDEALANGADQVLLDNFDADGLREAVRRTRDRRPGVVLEASGGLTLDSARAVGGTGVDLVAVGALTHSAPQLDLGLDWVEGF